MSHHHHKKHDHPHEPPPKKEGEEAHPKEEAAPQQPKMITIPELELQGLKDEIKEYKDKYLRQLAESENARKRMQKERQELTQYAVEQVIVDFLHPLDNMENALRAAGKLSDELKNWVAGFQMILVQFKDVLTNQGVTPVEAIGTAFDPHVHEAVESVETSESAPGTVIEECVRGYKIGDRTIRPARVKVAKAKVSENK